MILLIVGVLLWALIHFSKTWFAKVRISAIDKLGHKGYKITFSLVVVLSIIFMVIGWRASGFEVFYYPPSFTRHITALLMLFAFILFFAARVPTNLKRFFRHPQLLGVIVWSLAHLISNGEVRSVILFGGMGAWALLQTLLINRREGAWRKPEKFAKSGDLRLAVVSLVVYAIFIAFLHQFLFGVRPY